MKNKVFTTIILTFLVFFIVLMIAAKEGYYQNRNEKAKILTEEQIKKFEKDVENNKDIDIEDYVLYKDKDYTNKTSDNVYKISLKLEKVIDKTIKLVFNGASSAVND